PAPGDLRPDLRGVRDPRLRIPEGRRDALVALHGLRPRPLGEAQPARRPGRGRYPDRHPPRGQRRLAHPRDPLLPLTRVADSSSAPGTRSGGRNAFALALALAGAVAVVAGVARVHEQLIVRHWDERAAERHAAREAALEERTRRILGLLQASADRVAALPETAAALGRERTSVARLFRSLETLSDTLPEHPALAVHGLPFSTVAWAGRVADLRGIQAMGTPRRGLFVLSGAVTTLFVATAPVSDRGGRILGLGTAELAVRVHRNITNEYLRDYDL